MVEILPGFREALVCAASLKGEDRRQDFLLPASLDDYVSEDNPVRVVEAFIDELNLVALGFEGMEPAGWAVRPSLPKH